MDQSTRVRYEHAACADFRCRETCVQLLDERDSFGIESIGSFGSAAPGLDALLPAVDQRFVQAHAAHEVHLCRRESVMFPAHRAECFQIAVSHQLDNPGADRVDACRKDIEHDAERWCGAGKVRRQFFLAPLIAIQRLGRKLGDQPLRDCACAQVA